MLSLIFAASSLFFSVSQSDSLRYNLIVGSYTSAGNAGIEVYSVDINTGKSAAFYSVKTTNASYLTVSQDLNNLYAVNESGSRSAVSAFELGGKGQYEFLNSSLTTGDDPCFITYREASKTAYTANYSGGSLSVFKTDHGRLSPVAQHIVYKGSSINKARQQESHAHNVVLSPDQYHLYVTDLGTDKIYQHRIYADGLVDEHPTVIAITPGSGPRHMTFNSTGSNAYLINELTGVVDVFGIENGNFKLLQSIVADTAASSNKGSADIHISPNGKWLLTSNRVSSNEVTVFAIQKNGRLEKVYHQPVANMPRNFSFDPTGKFVFVASQKENKIQVFTFDDQIGRMKDTKQDILVKAPVCLVFTASEAAVDPEERIRTLGIQLIPPVAPVANYVKFVQVGNTVYLSGHGPDKPGGGQVYGKLGKDLTVEQGKEAARLTGISLISTLKGYLGDLNKVKRVVKVLGLVNSDSTFGQQPAVMNGFSDLMVDVFGNRGKHARSSVGVNALPNNIAVEIEMIVELK